MPSASPRTSSRDAREASCPNQRPASARSFRRWGLLGQWAFSWKQTTHHMTQHVLPQLLRCESWRAASGGYNRKYSTAPEGSQPRQSLVVPTPSDTVRIANGGDLEPPKSHHTHTCGRLDDGDDGRGLTPRTTDGRAASCVDPREHVPSVLQLKRYGFGRASAM